VPLKIYFNEKGRAKIEIALARGKQLHDKRETEKARDWNREKGRLLRGEGIVGSCAAKTNKIRHKTVISAPVVVSQALACRVRSNPFACVRA
jgi:hypothetical protein